MIDGESQATFAADDEFRVTVTDGVLQVTVVMRDGDHGRR